ncbi:hypothetical protein F5B22DRAFT_592901 [Xylaria bambusicola]|uniref:uncharacterized protein n=1 Tax=Xylaria bambusicola TaxID=326684 RepID=UPI002007E1A4|nr:uncharacterized protein F5B22DRAFT_592901 [Xylaria bambusicola]KAI0522124.1 hypothetical protein F5B22DRAFT_592901 [Xylaria bambusicola]
MPQARNSPKPKRAIREAVLRLSNTFVFRDAAAGNATVRKTAKKRDTPGKHTTKPVAGHKKRGSNPSTAEKLSKRPRLNKKNSSDAYKSSLKATVESYSLPRRSARIQELSVQNLDLSVPVSSPTAVTEDENVLQHLAFESLSLASSMISKNEIVQGSTGAIPTIVVTEADEDVSREVSAPVYQQSEALRTRNAQSKPLERSFKSPTYLAPPSIPSFTFSCKPTAPFTAFKRCPPPPSALPSFSMFREFSTLALPRDSAVSTPILPGPPLPVPPTLPSFNELVESIERAPSRRTFVVT